MFNNKAWHNEWHNDTLIACLQSLQIDSLIIAAKKCKSFMQQFTI